MLVGLNGAGKTTTAAKLARHLRDERGRRPYLVPADVYRPAAIQQLETLGRQIEVPVHVGVAGRRSGESRAQRRRRGARARAPTRCSSTPPAARPSTTS